MQKDAFEHDFCAGRVASSRLQRAPALRPTPPHHFIMRLAASTGRARLDSLALADRDRGLVVHRGRAHALLDLPGHGQKGLLDVGSVLGRRLEEGDAEAVGEFLPSPVSTAGVNGFSCKPSCYLRNSVLHDLLVRHI